MQGVIKKDIDVYKNTLDPFSAVIDAMLNQLSLSEWLENEKKRVQQKTLQNMIGEIHPIVIGNVQGWKNLKTGKVIDIVSKKYQIIAEIKNKHNTTKGNHKVAIYDDLKMSLDKDYQGYTGYYVEILPKNGSQYNKTFTPPDNKTKKNRPSREDIRVVDGKTFYALVTGDQEAIIKLYNDIPEIIYQSLLSLGIPATSPEEIKRESLFIDFINKVF